MQIPYDLEFVESRPTVSARAIALPEPMAPWHGERPRNERDAFDTLLHWAFRMLRRLENRN